MARIEEIIGEDFTVVGYGRYLKTLEHDSLVIDSEKQVFYWNSKHIVGNALDWLTKVKGLSFKNAKDRLGEITPLYWAKPDDVKKDIIVNDALVDVFYEYGKMHREYWTETRGYTHATIDLFRLGYTGDWYTIPFFLDGKFRNFQCRKPADESGKKSMKSWYGGVGSLPFNLDFFRYQEWGVLTEGPVDAIMAMQNRIPAMSSNVGAGHFSPLWAGKVATVKEIFIVYDNDDAGRNGAVSVAKFFGDKARIYCFDGFPNGFDVTNFFKDGGTRDEFLDLIFNKSKRKEEI